MLVDIGIEFSIEFKPKGWILANDEVMSEFEFGFFVVLSDEKLFAWSGNSDKWAWLLWIEVKGKLKICTIFLPKWLQVLENNDFFFLDAYPILDYIFNKINFIFLTFCIIAENLLLSRVNLIVVFHYLLESTQVGFAKNLVVDPHKVDGLEKLSSDDFINFMAEFILDIVEFHH